MFLVDSIAWGDSKALLSHVMNLKQKDLLLHYRSTLDDEQSRHFYHLLDRVKLGEPAEYVVGRAHFWNYEFLVTLETLIPRPDSEVRMISM